MSNTQYGKMLLDIIDGLNEDIEELAESQSFQEWLMHKHKDLYFKLLDEFWKEKGMKKECVVCKEKTFDENKEVCINCGSGMTLWSENDD